MIADMLTSGPSANPTAATAAEPNNASCGTDEGTSAFFSFQELSADELLAILLHLNVIDLSHVALTSKRLLYLTHALQTKIVGTECSALSEKSAALQVNKDARKLKTHRGGKRSGNYRPADVVRRALSRLRAPPTIAFLFHTSRGGRRTAPTGWYQESPSEVERLLPPSCAILSASARDIQANCDGLVESESGVGVLLASFDRSTSRHLPFAIASPDSDDSGEDSTNDDDEQQNLGNADEIRQLLHRLEEERPPLAGPNYWKIIFVYVCGNSTLDPDVVLARVQTAHPNCTIVGGVAEAGHVRLFAGKDNGEKDNEDDEKPSSESIAAIKQFLSRKSTRQLRIIISELIGQGDAGDGEAKEFLMPNLNASKDELVDIAISMGFTESSSADPGECQDLEQVLNGIFGVAIGGEVPVRAVVSRGARSLTTQEVAPQSSPWTVTEAAIVRPGELGHPFYRGDPAGGNVTYHVINRVKSSETGEELDGVNFVLDNRAEFLGLRRCNTNDDTTSQGDGFDLTMVEMPNVGTGKLMIAEMGSSIGTVQIASHVGSQIDIFNLDGNACIQDVKLKLDRLKELVVGQRLLAGLMFSCNGRGPDASYLIDEEMCDARTWSERFPSVPMLGFYAGGEIGPRAIVGNRNIFQCGHAALQGFTAVFVLFIVPKMDIGCFSLDDGRDSIDMYMRERMNSGRSS